MYGVAKETDLRHWSAFDRYILVILRLFIYCHSGCSILLLQICKTVLH